MKIWVVVGTRPEVIKQVPLYWACQEKFGKDNVKLIGTGQHRELLVQALEHFGATLDANFEIMKPGQSLSKVAAAVLERFDEALDKEMPDWVIVQGDTTTAAMSAIAAFHRKVKVAHNEAGLRSHDLSNPFPEEANRKLISAIADLHLAPTELARSALLREGIDPTKIHVVGNTGVDALLWTLKLPCPDSIQRLLEQQAAKKRRPVLLTAHRRENAGAVMDKWFQALRKFLASHPELCLVYPVHPNNLAREYTRRHLEDLDNVIITTPFSYLETAHLLRSCKFVVTDSGGIQEEAATLGIPTVVCRKTTERMEAVHAGIATLVDPDNIDVLIREMGRNSSLTAPQPLYPFGHGSSSPAIAKLLH
jgi:UDP-N-acetylglucosamine 2-epimerase (non-hydrolysing)